jgi:ribose transport system ATP-binding protein
MPETVEPRTSDQASRLALDANQISKTFERTVVLDHLDFRLASGEVHALLGHNGSGKSTFIKILAGFHAPDASSGRIMVAGEELRWQDPGSAQNLGLSFVHQTLGLVPALTVLENLHLGMPYEVGPTRKINWRREARLARSRLEEFGLDVDPADTVERLTAVERTEVAIVRALSGEVDIRVLVLDEPTAALTAREVEKLFELIKRVSAGGVAVIYVSHRLEEVSEIADSVTVLRDGRTVGDGPIDTFGMSRLVELISGDAELRASAPLADAPAVAAEMAAAPEPGGAVPLKVSGVAARSAVDVDFEARRGEILGIVGLLGSGVDDIARVLSGRVRRQQGKIEIFGRPLDPEALADAKKLGYWVVVGEREDRSVLTLTVGENLTLSTLRRYFQAGFQRLRRMRVAQGQAITDFGILPADGTLTAQQLSGGNQQKVALARVIQADPSVLVLEEPFKGVDIRGRREIADLLRAAAGRGRTVVIVDSDLEAVSEICTRAVVLRDGIVSGEFEGAAITKNQLVKACYGEAV